MAINKILDFIRENIIITDDKLLILYYNKNASKLISESDKKEKIIDVVSFPDMDKAFHIAKNGGIFSEQLPAYFGDKRIECKITVFKEDSKINWIFDNITKFKALERAKADFVSAVSHEFMTPLSVIEGFLFIIKDSKLERKTKNDYIKRSISQLKRLERLVEQLLTLSELEMKKYTPVFSNINLKETILEIIEEFRQKWEKKNIKIKTEINRELSILTDKNGFYLIFGNLLSNSIKYSYPDSEITIKVESSKEENIISISDNGIGIKEDEIPRIFERFYRGSNSSDTNSKGMGLGLALVKHLSKVIGVRVKVHSRYKIGSTFYIILDKTSSL